MKCLVIMFALISLAALQSTEVEATGGQDIEQLCKQQNNVTDAEVIDMKANKNDTSNVKSMRACILKREGLMDDQGRINKDAVKSALNPLFNNAEVVASIAEACGGEEANSDHPDAASRHAKCIIAQLAARNIRDKFY